MRTERMARWGAALLLSALLGTQVPAAGVQKIVFTSNADGDNEIHIMNPDGSGVVRLTDNTANDLEPRWSPDGRRIAFYSNRDGDNDIYVMDADGSNVVQLSNDPGSESDPHWSPDGSRIVFSREIAMKVWRLFAVDADGTNLVQLGTSGKSDHFAMWSPDGATVVFVARVVRDGSNIYYVYLMDADGTNVRPLTGELANEGSHSWSPDGSQILFYSDRDGDKEIYLIDADGANLVQLTDNSVTDSATWFEGSWTTAFPGVISISVPQVTTPYATPLVIPVEVAGVSGSEIVSAEVFVRYDSTLLAFDEVVTPSTLTDGWSIEHNQVDDSGTMKVLKIAAATDQDEITSDGTLLQVQFTVEDVRHPASSVLELTHVLLNDGDPENATTDGSVTLIGVDGTIVSAPVEIIPRWDIDVTVTDADEDRDGLNADDGLEALVDGLEALVHFRLQGFEALVHGAEAFIHLDLQGLDLVLQADQHTRRRFADLFHVLQHRHSSLAKGRLYLLLDIGVQPFDLVDAHGLLFRHR